MGNDPIVEEVRKAGRKLAKAAGNNKKAYIKFLQEKQKKSRRKVVSFSSKRPVIA